MPTVIEINIQSCEHRSAGSCCKSISFLLWKIKMKPMGDRKKWGHRKVSPPFACIASAVPWGWGSAWVRMKMLCSHSWVCLECLVVATHVWCSWKDMGLQKCFATSPLLRLIAWVGMLGPFCLSAHLLTLGSSVGTDVDQVSSGHCGRTQFHTVGVV